MATFVFHNNFHRSNHHTVPFFGFPDSASDQIASFSFPFKGLFYNNVYGISGSDGLSNSLNWYSTFITVTSNYIDWGLFPNTYTTVNSFSSNWQYGKQIYTICNSFSSNWFSANETYNKNVDIWNNSLDGYNLYINQVQENTLQKSFSADYIKPSNPNNVVWDLSSNQVAVYITAETSNFSNFFGGKKGGIYNLLLVTDATCDPALTVTFDSNKFKLANNTYSYSVTGVHIRKFNFIYDGKYLHGKSFLYDVNPPDRNLYYAGAGIVLYDNNAETNPISLESGEQLITALGGGLTIVGKDPYSTSVTVRIDGSEYNRDFIFSFTTLSAMSASTPYGELGSQDRIDVFNPNLTATNATVKNNSLLLNKCDTYESIKITTKAYGYISSLIINDVETRDFVMDINGYANHETGHVIFNTPSYDDIRTQSIFVKFGQGVPLLSFQLSADLALWLDAMDFSTVKYQNIGSYNYVTSLSSKISGGDIIFNSLPSMDCHYNLLTPKQSFNYNGNSTHYRNLVLSGHTDFLSFTVFTPSNSSKEEEWIWSNGNYGIFKIPYSYSIGIGLSGSYYTYDYGKDNKEKPLCVSTRYSRIYKTQEVFINDGPVTSLIPLSTSFGYGVPSDHFTMIGGLNPLTGFSTFKLHEMILYRGYKNARLIDTIRDYLLDKWKFL
jgi:hypothetical protein